MTDASPAPRPGSSGRGEPVDTPELAGTFRRLAAAVYDGLLLLALLILFTAAMQLFTGGEAISFERVGAWEYAFQGTVLGVVALYFGSAWTRRGETLGMKAWRIRLERDGGGLPDWGDVLRRLLFAVPLYGLAIAGTLLFMARGTGVAGLALLCLPLVASYAWHALRRRGTLHDRWSRTRVARVPKG